MNNINDLFHESMTLDEMAISRNEVRQKIESYSKSLVEHVLKCLALGNSTWNLEHWEMEIAEWLKKSDALKWNGKNKLDKEEYKNLLKSFYSSSIETPLNRCEKFISIINKEYGSNIVCTRELVDFLYDTLEEIINTASDILCTKGSRNREVFLDIVKDSVEKRID